MHLFHSPASSLSMGANSGLAGCLDLEVISMASWDVGARVEPSHSACTKDAVTVSKWISYLGSLNLVTCQLM